MLALLRMPLSSPSMKIFDGMQSFWVESLSSEQLLFLDASSMPTIAIALSSKIMLALNFIIGGTQLADMQACSQ